MASKTVIRTFADGSKKEYKRCRQGRKTSGLGKPEKFRLFEEDNRRLEILKNKLGYLYNKNDIVRIAVKIYLDNSVPTELLKP